MNTFAADIEAFAKKANMSLDKTVRGIELKLLGAIVKTTPKDTGRAMGNWQTTTEAPATGVLGIRSQAEAIAEIKSASKGAGSITYMANNLPYIYRLENGWSSGTPPGAMVKMNFERVAQIVNESARENRV